MTIFHGRGSQGRGEYSVWPATGCALPPRSDSLGGCLQTMGVSQGAKGAVEIECEFFFFFFFLLLLLLLLSLY